jgi:hypothetical protein
MKTATATDTPLGHLAVDVLLESYLAWREECAAVWQAYQRWVDAERQERRLAHAAYVAALDREERAAGSYAERIEWVTRISP